MNPKTSNQLAHCAEQSEAMRQEFQVLWNNQLRVKAIELGLNTPRQLFAAEVTAWNAFKAAKTVTPRA